MVKVPWGDAAAYCAWLGGRLPACFGGSWYFYPWYLRSSYRFPGDLASDDDSHGFRSVIPAVSEP